MNRVELSDSQLARKLQEQYDSEVAAQLQNQFEECANGNETTNYFGKSGRQNLGVPTDTGSGFLISDISPVDSSLECSDPNPDIRVLFLQFNTQFFWGKLSGVEVKWSPRMTLCAGLCVYEGHGGLCSVRLSLPLLKLRPRKDLVETLLHEMIHAYLFVTCNDRDHDDHGPQFKSHMNRINKATGASISIYHTFHDEVASYQQHWWRCDGPCQNRRPYFGYVKRAMNRAPSPKDFWWAEHQASCGGTYTKIKEPEGYGKKKGGKKEQEDKPKTKDIRAFGGKGHVLGSAPSKTSSTNKPSNTSSFGSSRNPATIFNMNNNRANNSSTASTSTSANSKSSTIVNGILQRSTGNITSSLFSEIQSTKVLSDANRHSKPNVSKTDNDKEFVSMDDDDDDLWMSDINNIEAAPLSSLLKGKGVNKKIEIRNTDKNVLSDSLKKKSVFSDHRKKHRFSFQSKYRNKKPSVCRGGEFYEDRTKRKKKYVLDELDSNDELWDGPFCKSVAKNPIKTELNISPLKARLKEKCCVNDNEKQHDKSKIHTSSINSYFSSSSQRQKGNSTTSIPESSRGTSPFEKQIKREPIEPVSVNRNKYEESDREKFSNTSLYEDIVDLSDFDDEEFAFVSSRIVVDKHNKSEKISPSQRSIGRFFTSSGSKKSNKRKSVSKSSIHEPDVSSSSSRTDVNELPDISEDDFKANCHEQSSDDVDISDDGNAAHSSFKNKLSKANDRSKKSSSETNIGNYFSTPSGSSTSTNIDNGYLGRNKKMRGNHFDDHDDIAKKGCIGSKKRQSGRAFCNDGDSLEDCDSENEDSASHSLPSKRRKRSVATDSSCALDNDEAEEQVNREEDNDEQDNQVNCPVCSVLVSHAMINSHLDSCLG